MNKIVELRWLGVGELIITTSHNVVMTDDTVNFNLDAKQNINYQKASYKLYGDNLDAMLQEMIDRATKFKEMTTGQLNSWS